MLAIEEIQKLKKDQLGLVTVLSGEDTGQYQIAKEVLLEQIGFESADLNFAYFDMSEVDYAQVDLDLVSLPFFADEKIVILDSDEELKQFEAYLSNPSETTRLIILVPGKLDSKRRLVKLLKRDALNLETNSLKEADVRLYFKKVYFKKVVSLLIETEYQIKTGRMDKAYLFDVALLKMVSFL